MADVESIPEAFEVLNYPSELHYYFSKVLNLPAEETTLDLTNVQTLFSLNISDYQTLINPVNLNYFYEKFKVDDMDSIQKRFSVSTNLTHL